MRTLRTLILLLLLVGTLSAQTPTFTDDPVKMLDDTMMAHSKALASAMAKTNDDNLRVLDLIARRAGTDDLQLIKEIMTAKEAIGKNAQFFAKEPVPSRNRTSESLSVACRRELWQLKCSRDNALEIAQKRVAPSFKNSYEKIYLQAISNQDIKTAEIAQRKSLSLDFEAQGQFVGKWIRSKGKTTYVLKSDGTCLKQISNSTSHLRWRLSGKNKIVITSSGFTVETWELTNGSLTNGSTAPMHKASL